MNAIRTHVEPDAGGVAAWCADHFEAVAAQAIAARGRCVVALSGGSTPRGLYQHLAAPETRNRVDWARTVVLFGDERCVPPDHPDSNYRMARQALLDHVPIPAANVARMLGEAPPEIAAREYQETIARLFPGSAPAAGRWPRIDLVLLGMGPDGHTASLFPETAALSVDDRFACANYVEKLASWRLTLTRPVLQAARVIWLLVCGADKAAPLARVFERSGSYPVELVFQALGDVTWVLDRAAAASLPPALHEHNSP